MPAACPSDARSLDTRPLDARPLDARDTEVLSTCVRASLARYFQDLGEAEPRALWPLVMGCVERALLETVMVQAQGNQTRAAEMLGMTRNTLRKKLLTQHISSS